MLCISYKSNFVAKEELLAIFFLGMLQKEHILNIITSIMDLGLLHCKIESGDQCSKNLN